MKNGNENVAAGFVLNAWKMYKAKSSHISEALV